MNNKSYVSLEQNICPICGEIFSTNNILMDEKLRNKFNYETITGYSLCKEHKELYSQGYVALVGIDENKSNPLPNKKYNLKDVHRTGKIVHIKALAFQGLFNQPPPEGPFVFTSNEVISKLEEIA